MRCIRSIILFPVLMLAGTLLLIGCQPKTPGTEPVHNAPPEVQEPRTPQGTPATEMENLVKLCKVWGYTKYYHPTFLFGKKDWDEELLTLIPQVRELETAEEVNDLLYHWFAGLGEIDYGRCGPIPSWSTVDEDKKVFLADTSWTKDAGYLGKELAAGFAGLPEELPNIRWKDAPVFFDGQRVPSFDNEPEHDAGYDDPNSRLLGLFRLWNGFEYFYPYLHLLDRDWTESLAEQIPNMLSGTDGASYQRTLWHLARETYDAHTGVGGYSEDRPYRVPVSCIPAEGVPVVWTTAEGFPLERGDVLLRVDGQTVDEILEEKYGNFPQEFVAIEWLSGGIFCREEQVELGILRDSEEITLTCNALKTAESTVSMGSEIPYELLDDTIGYININRVRDEDVLDAIEAFRDTQGLVIDLREYPVFWPNMDRLFAFVLGKSVEPLTFARPSMAVPGAYTKDYVYTYGTVPGFNEHYDRPVVVLTNDGTGSTGECYAAAFQAGENTVLMGGNTDGCNGATREMPLPGGLWVRFAILGAYHPDGTQTQRTGIAPDIRVEPTIQGIAESRDEVLEAAVEYIENAQ